MFLEFHNAIVIITILTVRSPIVREKCVIKKGAFLLRIRIISAAFVRSKIFGDCFDSFLCNLEWRVLKGILRYMEVF